MNDMIMKNYIHILYCILWFPVASSAQDVMVVQGFKHTQVIQQDSILVISNLGVPMSTTASQNNVVATSSSAALFIAEDTSTFIPSIRKIEGIHLYPNPTPGILVMQREDTAIDLIIDIFDEYGILLRSIKWPPNVSTYQPSLQTYPAGTYFVSIRDQDNSMGNQYKILKQ
jgi:hypothetical protein